jgi:hypothetical protein
MNRSPPQRPLDRRVDARPFVDRLCAANHRGNSRHSRPEGSLPASCSPIGLACPTPCQ